jgi:hypothetical protein
MVTSDGPKMLQDFTEKPLPARKGNFLYHLTAIAAHACVDLPEQFLGRLESPLVGERIDNHRLDAGNDTGCSILHS